ncbi:putative dipeptidase 1 precursor [Triangularia verruculosa]|uniref:Dipeptidase n=1 Tax=Triangularia verruculosa TaxID=2587418 RepID=A0AAN6X9K9_9PEZI|nr:putative dipeptidase 1 precursor [Triangularia verruculosa]
MKSDRYPKWAELEAGDFGSDSPSRPRRSARAKKVTLCVVFSCLLLSYLFLPIRGAGYIPRKPHTPKPQLPQSIEERVKHILSHTPLVDGHNDLAILLRAHFNNHIYNDNFTKPFTEGGLTGHVDIPRLRDGMNGGAFWSVFWPCPSNGSNFSDSNYGSIVASTLSQIDLLHRLSHSYPDTFSPISNITSSSALHSFHHNHELISPLGIEGLHQIANSPSILRQYHSLGVRYATLTHNCPNKFADSALDTPSDDPRKIRIAPPVHHGLSVPHGVDLIKEMNRIGMIIDLSHTSVDTMLDVLGGNPDKTAGSKAPVMFSHSSAYEVCPHPRNVPDQVLDLVKRNGGVVMVNFAPDFISCTSAGEGKLPDFDEENATLEQVVRHVRYIGERIGWEHVGFGSDFDGIETVPKGLEDVSKYPDLVGKLLEEGVGDEYVKKVVGGNVLRVWAEVERVAKEMQERGEPVMEDELHSLW